MGPRMMLSQPMMVVSVAIGVLVLAAPGDFTGVDRLAGFFSTLEGTGLPDVVTFVATLSGDAFNTAGVEETGAAATESAFDPPPG